MDATDREVKTTQLLAELAATTLPPNRWFALGLTTYANAVVAGNYSPEDAHRALDNALGMLRAAAPDAAAT